VFIKLGQVLSTRSDLLPADVIAELSGLQDGVPPAPPAQIAALLSQELGAPAAAVLAHFDPTPVAAASIAQAHRARLHSGEEVIVKVQRPGIRALVDRDLDIMLRLARTLEARAAWARSSRVVDLAQGFAVAVGEELDFTIEARNISAVAAALGPDGPVRAPRVYQELSTSRVLVMERLDGPSIATPGRCWTAWAPTGRRWPADCWTACCARSCCTAPSTPTPIPATSLSCQTSPWARSTSARSGAWTRCSRLPCAISCWR